MNIQFQVFLIIAGSVISVNSLKQGECEGKYKISIKFYKLRSLFKFA